ncbi:MAG: hypothetical protein CMN86_12225 [Stappia sp.]|nr:hypothetical protein [Stappia sp.]
MSWNLRNRTSRGESPDSWNGAADGRDVGEADGWYAPQNRAPAWQRGGGGRNAHPDDGYRAPRPGAELREARQEREIARAQLDDVADALGRLMQSPEAAPAAGPNRHARRAAASRTRSEARAPARSQRPTAAPSGGDARTSRIEAVLGALDRLDRRVEDLAHTTEESVAVADEAPAGANGIWHQPDPRDYAPSDADYDAWRDQDDFRSGDNRRGRGDYGSRDTYRTREARMAPRERMAHDAMAHGADDDLRPLIQDLARRIDGAAGPRAAELSTLRGEIGELRAMLMESLRSERGRPQPRDTGEMRRLSDAVERLRADRGDMRLLNDLRDEIADLRATIGQSNVDGMLKTLESGYAHLVQRLDELGRGRVEPRVMDELADRLADIESAFRIVPRADQLSALDDRVADIGHRVEELVRRNSGEDVQALRGEIRGVRELVERIDVRDVLGDIDESMAALGQRLDVIDRLCDDQRAMADRLDAIERRVPHGGAIDRLNDRLNEITGMLAEDRSGRSVADLDERLGEISGRLKRIENARQMPPSYDAAFTLLEKRLAAIDGKIDTLDRPESMSFNVEGASASVEADLIARLESGIARLNERFENGAPAGDGDLGGLRQEIAALRESVSRPALDDDLEARLRDLADTATRGAGSTDTALLGQVEEKIAYLAAKLDAAESGFARLDSLSASAGEGDGAIAAALRDDLHRLMDAATSSEQRSRETMDSVQDVLASINTRLQALEAGGGAAEAIEIEDTRPLEPGSGKPPRRRMSQPAPQPVRRETATARPAAEARPDPGAEALRKAAAAASAAQAAGDQGGTLRDRKADFIAAARRAAQAASEEAETRKGAMSFLTGGNGAGEGEQQKTGGWLRSRLPGRRKAATSEDGKTGEADTVAPEVQAERREGSRRNKGDTRDAQNVSAPDVTIEPPVADEQQGAGGRQLFSRSGRRAVLLAAAAVVIALGALQMVKLVTPGLNDVASVEQPPAIEGSATPEGRVEPASVAADEAAREMNVAGRSPEPEAGSQAGRNAAAADKSVSGEASRAADMAGHDNAAAADGGAPVTGTAARESREDSDVAFAPPAGAATGFSATPGAIPAPSFQARGATPASAAKAVEPKAEADAADVSGAGVDPAALAAIPADAGSLALRQAAAKGNPAALFTIAVNYTEGTGGAAPDLAAAARYYEKAAEAGLAPAQYRLGSLYEKGRGVERSLETARDWYLRAAEQGNAKAAHNLAVLYAEGLSGTPEFRDAAYWFKRAAAYGLADSQYNLGILYARGLGLEKNLVESYKWFALAARQGDTEAGKKRDEVANMLSTKDLAEARLSVENWTDQPRTPAANEVETKPSWTAPASSVSKASFTADPRELVMNVQRLLAARGFDPGTPDGQIGPRTREAVRAYQEAAGMRVTGAISTELLASLTGTAI